jgi:hypothetical protein
MNAHGMLLISLRHKSVAFTPAMFSQRPRIETADPTHQFGESVSLGHGVPVSVTTPKRSLPVSLAIQKSIF